jgi:endogenous inhibitor of DNA gyrase (YacG/DUF329 family)
MLSEKSVELFGGFETKTGLRMAVAIREMSGWDEETIFNPKLARNPEKLITELLFNVIADGDLTKNQIHEIYGGDRDILLLELRRLSYGDEMTMTIPCPRCRQESDFLIHLEQVELKPFKSVDTPFELKKGFEKDKVTFAKGKLFQPKGRDNEQFTQSLSVNVGRANSELLASCVKFDDLEEVTVEDIGNLSAKEKNQLLKLMGDNSFGPDLEQEVSCPECGDKITLSISLVDLFRPEL